MKALIILCLLSVSPFAYAFSEKVKAALDADSVEGFKDIKVSDLETIEKDDLGLNPLSYSLQFKKNKVAEYLLDKKLGINIRDYLGRTPLMIGVSNDMPLDFINKFEAGKADYFVKDKNGRDIEFYASRSKNAEILKSINVLKSKISSLTTTDIAELKNILKNGNYSELLNFFEKHRTINFTEASGGLLNYLLDQNIISRWNIENLMGMGLDIFSADFPSKLIISGNSNTFSELLKFKINYGADSKGTPLVVYTLQNGVKKEIIFEVFEKNPISNYKDKEGNNLLHIALKNNRLDVVQFLIGKKVSLNKLNRKNESPLLLIAKTSDEAIVKQAFTEKSLKYDSRDEQGNDPVILLSKNYPQIFKEVQTKIFTEGYDYSARNSKNEGAISKQSLPSLDDVTKAVESLPRLEDKADLTQQLSVKSLGIDQLKNLDEKLKDETTYSGDRALDEFLIEAIESHVSSLKNKFMTEFSYLAGAQNNEVKAKLDKIEEKINKLVSNISRLETEKENLNNKGQEVQNDYLSFDAQREMGKVENSINGVVQNFQNLKNYVNDVNADMQDLKDHMEMLNNYLKLLRNGKVEYSAKILKIQKELSDLKNDLVFEIQKKDTYYKKDLDYLRSDFNYSEKLVTMSSNDLDYSRKSLTSAENVNQTAVADRDRNIAYIFSNAHKNEHIEDAAKCKYVAARDEAIKTINKTNAEINDLKNKIQRLQSDFDKNLKDRNNKRNELTKREGENAKELKKYTDGLKLEFSREESRLKKDLSDLELIKGADFKKVTDDASFLKNQIETKYGSVDSIDQSWNFVYSTVGEIKSFDDLSKILTEVYLPGNFMVKPEVAEQLKKSPMGLGLISTIEEMVPAYNTYYKTLKSSNRFLTSSQAAIDLVSRIESNKTDLYKTKNELELMSIDKKRMLSELNSGSEEDFDSLVRVEELYYLNSKQGKDTSLYLEELNRLTSVLDLTKSKHFDSYNRPLELMPVNVVFNDLILDEVKIESEISKEAKAYVLQQWHKKLSNFGASYGSLYTPAGRELFVRSLVDSVKIYTVKDKNNSSIMISSALQKFIISEDGTPVSYEKDSESYFDFEVVSTGKVREEVLKTIALLKKNFNTDDLSLLKDSYDLWIITKLLKTADAINDVDKSLEMIETIKMSLIPVALLTPYGNGLSIALGLPECGLKLYKKSILGASGGKYSNVQDMISCTLELVELLGSEELDLSLYSLPKLIRGTIERMVSTKVIGNAKIRKGALDLIELLTGMGIDKLSEELDKFNPQLDMISAKANAISKINKHEALSVILLNEKQIKVTKASYRTSGIELAYPLPGNKTLLNICSLEEDEILKEIAKTPLKDLGLDMQNYSFINLKANEPVYAIQGSICLLIK